MTYLPHPLHYTILVQETITKLEKERYMTGKTNEKDSTNPKDLMGAKKDQIHLVPAEGIRGISKAMYYGAYEAKRIDGTKGYGPFNWRSIKVCYTVYISAILRHALAIADGEDLDPDSLQEHLDHIGANVCILKDAKKHRCLIDDRPTKQLENKEDKR